MAGKPGIRNVAGMRRRNKGGRHHLGLFLEKTALRKYSDLWLQEIAVQGYSNSKLLTNRWALEPFMKWAKAHSIHTPGELSKADLKAYQYWLFEYRKLNGKPLSATSQGARVGVIMRYFKWLHEQGYISSNPAEGLKMPKHTVRPLPKVLSHDQIRRILAQPNILDPLGLRDRTIIELIYATGVRRKELVNLDVDDVDLKNASLWVVHGKNGKSRVLPIADRVGRWLRAYLRRSRPKLLLDHCEKAFFITG